MHAQNVVLIEEPTEGDDDILQETDSDMVSETELFETFFF